MKLKYTKSNLRRINIFILISIILIFPMVISSNLSLYDSNIEDITKITNEEIILNNENLSTQTNYLVNRTQMNYVWNTLNFTGDSNASVAILSTGIDENQIKFGFDSYEDKNFTKKIVYWNDSTSIDSSTPIDPNGLGTFLSAVAFGRNNSDAELILDEQNRISTTLGGYYEHSDIMRGELKPGIYNISLGSFLINEENVNITINGTFTEIGATSEIQNANLSIYKNNSLVCRTNTISSTNYEIENYNITDNTGCYDVIFQYYHGLPDPDIACFSINTILNFSYNQCITNVANLSGVAPDTKIYSMRVLNESGEGYVNDLISALNWIISDHSDYNVVAATISLGTYDWTGTTLELLNNTIDDLIDEGIMVIIAAGDSGLNNDALNTLAQNQKALVVGAVNEYDQITYYSSMGKTIDGVTTKPDILAPGGSLLTGYQGIISADSNDNDGQGYYVDQASNDTTIMAGTSISATIVSAAYNLLVEAIGGYNIWENIMNEDMALLLKSYLLMTATETNINREDNPNTTYDESSISPVVNRGEKDIHEGFGVLNIEAALEAINRTMYVGNPESENIVSSNVNSSGRHVFARHISLEGNATYFFNLTFPSSAGTDLDLYLYYNETDTIGEPIILESSTTAGVSNESFYLGMLNETQNYFIVVKAVNGGDVEFLLDIEKQDNIWKPTLTDANIVSADGATSFNDTLQIFDFSINYTDKDNLAPLNIYLNISGLENNISLTKSNQDNNYTNGCFYTGSHRFYEAGTYLYHFGSWDGGNYSISDEYSIEIENIANAEYNNYTTDFLNINKWELEEGWYNLNQSSNIDDRGINYLDEWSVLYFGDNSTNKFGQGIYNYSSFSNAIFNPYLSLSPQIFLNDTSNPLFCIGTRISIATGDTFDIGIRTNRTGTWDTLESFTNSETDWSYLTYNLSEYVNNFIQIRFSVTKTSTSTTKNKGIMLTNFNIIQNPLIKTNEPEILNVSFSPNDGYKYSTFTFSAYFCDIDEQPPEIVYIEIDEINYTMFNIYGDWNSSYIKNGANLSSGGILYTFNACLAGISNTNYTIFALSDGTWYNSSLNLTGPTIEEESELVSIEGDFEDDGTKMRVYGTPRPNSNSFWVDSQESFHYIKNAGEWYTGYGTSYDISMITPLISLETLSEAPHGVYLTFDHRIELDSGSDYGNIEISNDLGESWTTLITYSTDIINYTSITIELNEYKGEDIYTRFNFHTESSSTAINDGWRIKNIKLKVNNSDDIINPTATFNFPANSLIFGNYTINISLSDNFGIDDSRVKLYIGGIGGSIIEDACHNGEIIYELDTTGYANGYLTIMVIGYDINGYKVSESIEIYIDNPQIPWLVIIIVSVISAIAIGLFSYYSISKRNQFDREAQSALFQAKGVLDEADADMNFGQKSAYDRVRKRQYEIKVRETVEKASIESEADKPFTLYCKKCKMWYKAREFELICPNCQKDSLYIAMQCQLCAKWHYKSEPRKIFSDNEYHCSRCRPKIRLLK